MPQSAAFEETVINDIVGREPSWIVRSGMSLIFVVMLILLSVTWFIQYPDKITSRIRLTTTTPPVELIAKTDGRIIRFFVDNGQGVNQGDPVALVESSVTYTSLQQLQLSLDSIDLKTGQLPIQSIQGLGELQPAVNELNLALTALHRFNQSSQLQQRVAASKVLKAQYELLQSKLSNKRNTVHQKLALEAQIMDKKLELKQVGLVTDTEIIELENRKLDKKLTLEDIDIQLELYNVTLQEMEQKLTEFKLTKAEEKARLGSAIEAKQSALRSLIAQWKQKYLISAAQAGKVSLSQYWSQDQQVKKGEVIASVIKQADSKIGKMLIQQRGAGKVDIGQRVNIEIASFPAVEYGYIEGEVASISLIPGNEGYMVDVSVPNELITTYKKSLPFIPNAEGNAQIITQDKRLLQRFFDKFLHLINGR